MLDPFDILEPVRDDKEGIVDFACTYANRAALINTLYLLDGRGDGEVAISLPGFASWVIEQWDVEIPGFHSHDQ